MSFVKEASDGVVLPVHVVPGAKREKLDGVWNNCAVKVAVMAPPTDSKANKALIEFLSFSLNIPKKNMAIISGLMSRDKKVKINGDKTVIIKEIDSWIQKSLMEKK